VIRILRRLLGLALLALAAWWAIRSLAERLDRELAEPGAYPNEWGVRIRPLTPAETAAAMALEAGLGGG